jgi:NAD+ synthetase
MPVLNPTALINNRCEAIQRYHVEAGIARAELDVSGGIDSAVMLMLLAEALGPENVTAVYSSINSSDASRRRARLVAEAAGVKLVELDLTDIYDAIALEAMRACEAAGHDTDAIVARMDDDGTVAGSLRSCLRAPIGRYLNRMTGGGIRHGTGNECEDRWLRFFQKGGDGEVDTNPIAMLSKGEVYQLAVALKVPSEIIEALPTPDLWGVGEKHNDEEELTKLSGGVEWTYSRVNPETGEYARVGTIERMSRFLDGEFDFDLWTAEKNSTVDDLLPRAQQFGLSREHLVSAQKWERATRHKMTPNCPSLGSREDLLNVGILTDELPAL